MFLLCLDSKIDLEISGFLPSFLYFILVQIKLHFPKVLRYYYCIHWTSYRINLFQFNFHVLSLRPLTLNKIAYPSSRNKLKSCMERGWYIVGLIWKIIKWYTTIYSFVNSMRLTLLHKATSNWVWLFYFIDKLNFISFPKERVFGQTFFLHWLFV